MKIPATTFPFAALLALFASASCHTSTSTETRSTLMASEAQAGWRSLFDGETTRGWRGFNQEQIPDGWQVVDGTLMRVGGGGDIITTDQFENFMLRLEWKVAPKGNSGIFFRVSEDYDTVWKTGPEFQILDNGGHRDGQSPLTSAGSNYALHAPARDVTRSPGEWNEVELEVRGDYVRHTMNGVELLSYSLWSPEWEQLVAESKFNAMPAYGRAKRGHIALQDHGDEVAFRNIRILPLPSSE